MASPESLTIGTGSDETTVLRALNSEVEASETSPESGEIVAADNDQKDGDVLDASFTPEESAPYHATINELSNDHGAAAALVDKEDDTTLSPLDGTEAIFGTLKIRFVQEEGTSDYSPEGQENAHEGPASPASADYLTTNPAIEDTTVSEALQSADQSTCTVNEHEFDAKETFESPILMKDPTSTPRRAPTPTMPQAQPSLTPLTTPQLLSVSDAASTTMSKATMFAIEAAPFESPALTQSRNLVFLLHPRPKLNTSTSFRRSLLGKPTYYAGQPARRSAQSALQEILRIDGKSGREDDRVHEVVEAFSPTAQDDSSIEDDKELSSNLTHCVFVARRHHQQKLTKGEKEFSCRNTPCHNKMLQYGTALPPPT